MVLHVMNCKKITNFDKIVVSARTDILLPLLAHYTKIGLDVPCREMELSSFAVNTSARVALLPDLIVPFISAIKTGTGIKSCFIICFIYIFLRASLTAKILFMIFLSAFTIVV